MTTPARLSARTDEARHGCATPCWARIALASLLYAAGLGGAHSGTMPPEPTLRAGRYALSVRTLLPHLDEMRLQAHRHDRGLGAADVAALFPVLDQPALRGCDLIRIGRDGTRFRYVLRCASARVATGTAEVSSGPRRIDARLDVKMGGKNMTFAQTVEAERIDDCATPPIPARAD